MVLFIFLSLAGVAGIVYGVKKKNNILTISSIILLVIIAAVVIVYSYLYAQNPY